MTRPLSPTDRTRIRRQPERARSDRRELYEILDGGLVCHLGVVVEGYPAVIPTLYARSDDTLYLHGSTGNRVLRAAAGAPVCVAVTHLDGLVLARAMFHHSANYRSAVVYGLARLVEDPAQKLDALRTVSEHLAPGRWDVARRPNRKELAQTAVLVLSLDEASVKVRAGGAKDEPEDAGRDVWAGVLPVRQAWGEPVPDSSGQEEAARAPGAPRVRAGSDAAAGRG